MRILVYEGHSVNEVKTLDLERWLGSDQYIVWVDMVGPTADDTRARNIPLSSARHRPGAGSQTAPES
jgi:hypothetical protein